jgi:FtsH-binding integral membrane protein
LSLVASFLVRLLQAVAGFLLFYGIEGMLSSAGLQPPNIVVVVALFVIVVLAAAAWRSERRPVGGLWVAGFVVALPLLLQSATPRSDPATPATPVVLAISAVALLLSLAGAVVEARGLVAQMRAEPPIT